MLLKLVIMEVVLVVCRLCTHEPFLVGAVHPSQGKTTANYHQPPSQSEFEAKRAELKEKYNVAKNEIKESAVFSEAGAWSRDFMRSSSYKDEYWTGKIISIKTDQGGTVAAVTIRSRARDIPIEYRTDVLVLPNPKDEIIKKGSYVYGQLSELSEGDLVKFKFEFIADDQRGVREGSITEEGSVTEPEFIVRFYTIEPYSEPSHYEQARHSAPKHDELLGKWQLDLKMTKNLPESFKSVHQYTMEIQTSHDSMFVYIELKGSGQDVKLPSTAYSFNGKETFHNDSLRGVRRWSQARWIEKENKLRVTNRVEQRVAGKDQKFSQTDIWHIRDDGILQISMTQKFSPGDSTYTQQRYFHRVK